MKTVLRETADDTKLYIRVVKWNSTIKKGIRILQSWLGNDVEGEIYCKCE